MNNYVIDYVNENEFNKKIKSLKKYNMLAYKELIFNCMQELKKGNFLGEITSKNTKDNIINYEYKLPTDKTFFKVYGNIILHYSVYEKNKIVMFNTITPEEILSEGHQKELSTYKGVVISKSHAERDKFKINLLDSINRNGFFNIKALIIIGTIITLTILFIIIL